MRRALAWPGLLLVALGGLVVAGCGSASFTVQPATLLPARIGAAYTVEIDALSNRTNQPDVGTGLETSGTLPPGLTFTSDHHGRATLSGTPTAAGSYSFLVKAAGYCTNFTCERAERGYTLVVDP